MHRTNRRSFITHCLQSGLAMSILPYLGHYNFNSTKDLSYQLDHIVPTKLYDGEKCWVHPRAGIVPYGEESKPRVVLTMNTLDLLGMDTFKGMYGIETDDLGASWKEVKHITELAPRIETVEGLKRPIAACDFWPRYHKRSRSLLGIGQSKVYTPEWKVAKTSMRHTVYSVYHPEGSQWETWKRLEMPKGPKFNNAGAGSTQRYDEEDGSILLPISFRPPGKNSHITMLRCEFDGKKLTYVDQGNELFVDDATRGLHEASVSKYNGMYYMTLRNDKLGFVTRSKDGMVYEPIRPWTFDDGQELGSYNTQQHWVTHSEALYLVYTRKGANNDHVFRHRAPLFMAEVRPDTMQVIRSTERILVSERGARLGNFGVTDISEDETWITVSEWMQPHGVDQYGSDGSVWIARLRWNKKNKLFSI